MLIARRNTRSAKPELHHWEPNANSGKPIIALHEKGVAFESHYTDMLEFDHHQPAYLSINPDGTIPISMRRAAAPHIVNERDVPRVIGWAARIAERPAVRAVLSSPERKRRSDIVFIPGPEHSRWG